MGTAPGDDLAAILAPNVVSPEAAVDLQPVRWTSFQPVAGATEVLVRATLAGGPPYAVLARVDVVETADVVTIGLWAGRRRDADSADRRMPQMAFPIVTSVRLREPLGQRSVHDAAR